MKALIYPFQQAQALAPLRSLCPDFLLPLAGKPMVEHLVESLVTSGIPDVTLLCDDRPEEVVRHFGSGERWGCALTTSAVREQGGLQRMVRAALHGVAGMVICLPGNLVVSPELGMFLEEVGADAERADPYIFGESTLIAVDAAMLLSVVEEHRFETLEDLGKLLRQKNTPAKKDEKYPQLQMISDLTGFIAAQRGILEGKPAGSRIPARSSGEGIWIGDHVQISPDVRLVAPLLIGSHCQISGSGQIGPNAVISPYCLVNNSDLICDSLIMSGTATGSHTELNGMAARGRALVNLRSGATVTSPDAFILGDVTSAKEPSAGDSGSSLLAAVMFLLLLPLGVPLLLCSLVVPSLLRQERYLGNRRMKTLAGDNPREPFTLRSFSCGPLLLRRWPGLYAVLAGDLTLVGAAAVPADGQRQDETDAVFGLDAARGLFHIWEVEGDLPESPDEQHARENFHAVTRSFAGDLALVAKAVFAANPSKSPLN